MLVSRDLVSGAGNCSHWDTFLHDQEELRWPKLRLQSYSLMPSLLLLKTTSC